MGSGDTGRFIWFFYLLPSFLPQFCWNYVLSYGSYFGTKGFISLLGLIWFHSFLGVENFSFLRRNASGYLLCAVYLEETTSISCNLLLQEQVIGMFPLDSFILCSHIFVFLVHVSGWIYVDMVLWQRRETT